MLVELKLDNASIAAIAREMLRQFKHEFGLGDSANIGDAFRAIIDTSKSDKLLKVSEVASKLGCSNEVVRRYIRAGKLVGGMAGKSYVVKASDLEAFIKRNTRKLA